MLVRAERWPGVTTSVTQASLAHRAEPCPHPGFLPTPLLSPHLQEGWFGAGYPKLHCPLNLTLSSSLFKAGGGWLLA